MKVDKHGRAISVACTKKGRGRIELEGVKEGMESHQATRQLQPLGSELSGKVGREVLKVLVSEPNGSPDLTPPGGFKFDCPRSTPVIIAAENHPLDGGGASSMSKDIRSSRPTT